MTPEQLEAAVLSGVKRMGEEGLSSLHSDVMGFLHAVDWAERWLLPLALFHLIVWSAVIGTRRSYEAQSCLLMGVRASSCPPPPPFHHSSSSSSPSLSSTLPHLPLSPDRLSVGTPSTLFSRRAASLTLPPSRQAGSRPYTPPLPAAIQLHPHPPILTRHILPPHFSSLLSCYSSLPQPLSSPLPSLPPSPPVHSSASPPTHPDVQSLWFTVRNGSTRSARCTGGHLLGRTILTSEECSSRRSTRPLSSVPPSSSSSTR